MLVDVLSLIGKVVGIGYLHRVIQNSWLLLHHSAWHLIQVCLAVFKVLLLNQNVLELLIVRSVLIKSHQRCRLVLLPHHLNCSLSTVKIKLVILFFVLILS